MDAYGEDIQRRLNEKNMQHILILSLKLAI